MKTITIELEDNGFKLKGLEDLQSRQEWIWLMLAARKIEARALEQEYLSELLKGLEENHNSEMKDKVRFLTKEEQEGLGIGEQVSPTYISIELPNNVPSKVKPIVILPNVECESVTVKATQYKNGYTEFESTLDPSQSHVINLNTGVE